jgi:hypothetical protein
LATPEAAGVGGPPLPDNQEDKLLLDPAIDLPAMHWVIVSQSQVPLLDLERAATLDVFFIVQVHAISRANEFSSLLNSDEGSQFATKERKSAA